MKRVRAEWIALAFVVGSIPVSSPSFGHGAIHEQIAAITRRLEAQPSDGALYLKRAELHRAERSWDAALADYDQAARFAPKLSVVDLARARALFEAGRIAQALAPVDRFLETEVDSFKARVLRGRILAELGRHEEAVSDFDRAVAVGQRSDMLEPDLYLYRADSQALAGRIPDAIAGLDEGIAQLGPLVGLELRAIELERAAGRFDHALTRVDAFLSRTARNEVWWLLRGEIQRQAGRTEQAHHDFARALAAIESLPSRQRNARRAQELETRVRSALAEVARNLP